MSKAFTLIELLVVVLIIGILSAIALPQYQKAVEKARIAEAKIILRNIYDATVRYGLSTGGQYNDEVHEIENNLDITPPGECGAVNVSFGNYAHACKTKNFVYYSDDYDCTESTSNFAECAHICAGRIGKNYEICLSGPSSSYGDGSGGISFECVEFDAEGESCADLGLNNL